jgi:hypothetical protein
MNAVRRDEPEVAAVSTRRRAERSSKRPTEGLRRSVPSSNRDFHHSEPLPEVPCAALEEEPATERSRRLPERGADKPLEVEAAQVDARGQLSTGSRLIEAADKNVNEGPEPIVPDCRRHEWIIPRAASARMIGIA